MRHKLAIADKEPIRFSVGRAEGFFKLNAAAGQFAVSYDAEKKRIASEKEAAENAVAARRVSALTSLSIIGGCLAAFVVLVLFLVLIRVDRSIREIATSRAAI
ncbi:hypothetical protein [Paraburkholderia youngii]|uniref:hypothetical protein n=1 Tax=Paraburkholderia youngii TaxID=2782701 RepID=UPI003D21EF2B